MGLTAKHLKEMMNFSLGIAKASSSITMKYYGRKIPTSLKPNNTPVTIADKKCEDYLIGEITKKYPSHSIFSEESGKLDNDPEFVWLIDPVDGTKNFIRHFPYWGTLLALEYQSEVVLGIIYMPALDELIYAYKSGGCFLNGKKVKVSNTENIKDSFCLFGGLDYILEQDYHQRFFNLIEQCNYNRGFGDCHAHSFVIKGNADFMLDPHVYPYDVAATKICVEEAGGRLTDTKGNESIYNGDVLISNGKLHDKVLRILNG